MRRCSAFSGSAEGQRALRCAGGARTLRLAVRANAGDKLPSLQQSGVPTTPERQVGRARGGGRLRTSSRARLTRGATKPRPPRSLVLTMAGSHLNAGIRSNLACKSAKIPVGSNRTRTPQVAQAAAAVQSAWEAGIKRQRCELLLPLIGATDLDDCKFLREETVGFGLQCWRR